MFLLFHLLFGLTTCFLGALPFGAINLSVVSVAVRKSYNQAVLFALGASLVEIAEAFIAVAFGQYINQFLTEYTFIPYLIGTVFLVVGFYFFVRKTSPTLDNVENGNKTDFLKGVVVALLNPQAIPFWLFALAFITPFGLLEFSGLPLILFLAGVFIGKLIALIGFAKMSTYLEKQLGKSCNTIDYIMGSVFVIIGSFQFFTHLQ